jgi:hypothetical protein
LSDTPIALPLPGATLSLPPVYLEAEIQNRLTRLANDKGIEFSARAA